MVVMYPFEEEKITENVAIRKFSPHIATDELIWHRDREDRLIEIIESNGWWFQRDEEVPMLLLNGTKLSVRAEEWHRVIRGHGPLVIKITKLL